MKKPNEIPSNLKRGALPEPHQALENIRRRNINRLIFAQLNINSLRNKFESLQRMINKNIDVLLISETKIDSSFPSAQFYLEGYATPYRLDRNANGGGILLYIREDIPSKLLNTDLSIEGFFVEIRLRKKKWLLCSSYNPKKNLIANHLKCIGINLDSQLGQYENFILMGNFNVEPNDANMKEFCQIYGCENIVKDKTCFKNPINPTYIDLIITNRPKSFQESEVIETGLSDSHKKASQKLNALARIAPYMCLEKRKTVMKAYIASQFGYCPLVWMFHSRSLNNKINSLHERALRITYGDRSSSFENLLKKDNSVSIHHRNIQALATEMFKVKNNIAPEIMKELFAPKMSSYDLCNNNSFKRRRVKSVWHGTESVSYLGPKIWDLVPSEIKEPGSLNGFKFKIKRWVPEGCPCRICKIYLGQVGFIVT